MKNLIIAGLISIFLVQSTLGALSCKEGYYDPGSGTKCKQCVEKFKTCTGAAAGTFVSSVTGWKDVAGTQTPYCAAGAYNSKTNNCDLICATGCANC